MKKIRLSCLFFALIALLSSCEYMAGRRAIFSSGDYDVVLTATPFKVKGVTAESTADAVEEGFTDVGLESAIVLFTIDKVLVGEFTQVRAGGASKLQQMKDAARDRDFWRIVKSDFTDPDEMTEQKWLTVAVQDPKKTFGFETWGTPKDASYKLYLKRVPDQPKSYILVKSQIQS